MKKKTTKTNNIVFCTDIIDFEIEIEAEKKKSFCEYFTKNIFTNLNEWNNIIKLNENSKFWIFYNVDAFYYYVSRCISVTLRYFILSSYVKVFLAWIQFNLSLKMTNKCVYKGLEDAVVVAIERFVKFHSQYQFIYC